MTIARTPFFAGYRQAFGPLSQAQVDGLNELLTFIEGDSEMTDVRHIAYLLATVKHECASRWKPIEEFGHGAGKRYGQPARVITPKGTSALVTYFGRGYCQLTWKDNYLKLSQAIGLGTELVWNPGRALEPATAYQIISVGMRKGLFAADHSLSHYIAGEKCDYLHARRIINGMDRAAMLESYAKLFEGILRASTT